MRPIHPSEVLQEELLLELDMSANAFAQAIGVPANRVSGIINGDHSVTVDTARRRLRVSLALHHPASLDGRPSALGEVTGVCACARRARAWRRCRSHRSSTQR
jgi:addiction module HigA family antidote